MLSAMPVLPLAACADAAPTLPSCGIQPLGSVPLVVDQGTLLVPVTLEGIRARMMLDTGSERTTIDPYVAGLLRLPDNLAHMSTLNGIGGATQYRRDVVIPEIQIGAAKFTMISLAVVDSPKIKGPPISGLLGADLLSGYDLDFDFPGDTLSIYRPGGCRGEPVLWSRTNDRIPLVRRGLLSMVRATLDGTEIAAVIDTGASSSIVMAGAAARMGLGAAQLMGDPGGTARGVGANAPNYRRHRFRRLQVGPLGFDAPELNVSDARVSGIDMLIGLDLLRQNRMWLSHTAGAVFFQRG